MTLVSTPTTMPPPPLAPPPPLLTVRGLTRMFGPGCARCIRLTSDGADHNTCPRCGTVVAVYDLSFEVGAGEVLGVVGESGSGKTTLLRCLHLDDVADAGEMVIEGLGDVFAQGHAHAALQRSTVVMVHQNALAAGLSVRLAAESNVAERLLSTGTRNFAETHEKVAALLTELGLHASRHRDPLHTFSGGMQQRVQLARALIDPPPVLLLDEPTTGLDPSVQADLLDVLQRVTDRIGAATLVVSHDLDAVRVLASRVVVLKGGRLVEAGLTEQVLNDPQHPYTRLLVASRLR